MNYGCCLFRNVEVDSLASNRPSGSVVEHSLGKGEVARSIRAWGTMNREWSSMGQESKRGKI
jgi:hypothetical protein